MGLMCPISDLFDSIFDSVFRIMYRLKFAERSSDRVGIVRKDGVPARPNKMPDQAGFIPSYGHYQELLSYQKAEIVYDLTFRFCQRFLGKGDRTVDQMIQAARSGKQNIAEGSKASGTSKELRSS